MDGVDKEALLKELKFLTGLLKKHEASKKEEKKSVYQQKSENLLPQKFINKPTNFPYKFVKTSEQSLTSFDKKYSFKKPKSIVNQRTVLNNNLKSKHETSISQASKCIKGDFKRTVLNGENLCATKRTVIYSENKLEKSSNVSDKSGKINSHIQLLEELKSVTELLKKKNSENKLLNSVSKNGCGIQNKLPVYKNNKRNNYNDYNKYKSINSESSIFSKTKRQTFSQKVSDGSLLNNRALNKKCYTKLNSNNKSEYFAKLPPQKHFDYNKYSYKKVASPPNSKVCCISTSLVGNDQTKNQFKKTHSGSEIRKVTYSSSKNSQESPSINPSAFAFKSLSSSKQNLVVKLNVNNDTVSSNSKKSPTSMKIKSSTFLKVKTPKSCKVSKLKPTGGSYVKINKHLITPNRSSQKSIFPTKKTRNISTKYKVVNNTLPCANKKVLNLLNSSDSKKNSPILMDASDSYFQNLNDSAIDKLEKDLLTISSALTSTPLSSEVTVNNYKTHQHSQTKINATLNSRMSLKKSRKRISKYKIINSNIPHTYDVKKRSFMNLKSGFKNVKYVKGSPVNKHLQPVHVLTPAKHGQSVLVKRLFKSKNTIINKNSTPTSYRAKMIKSKYLALNKRKSPTWQNHALYTQGTPLHKNIRGYLSSKVPSLHNRYKTTALAYHPKVVRKFPNCNYLTVNRQFKKSTSRNKLRKQFKNEFVNPPVVFIRGMRYSSNSSGKTLKKLPAKGQTKTRKRIIYGKAFVRNPESLMKVSPTSSYIASRVLNRSINRIISASTKKSLAKVNTYCMFYNRFGRCNKGVKCTYIHDPSKIAVCTRFLRGTCKIDGCPFSHEIAPGKMAICSFFLVGACEKENCPYRHEKLLPQAELCKAFVQGYCPDGKECKKAHILICPKYIQGDCDKGNACAYPHPPRKVKKNVQKEDEPEEKKSDDVLLEKVSRYFLQTEADKNKSDNAEKIFVPKQRKLEEQPSFIPLFQDSVLSSTE